MKFNFLKASTLAAGILVSGRLFAQSADTIQATNNYVKPFSGSSAFRTWSIGVNAGIMSTNTIFTSNDRLGFRSPSGELGYGAYIKDQILPSFGIQGDFMAGKLSGTEPQGSGAGTFNEFDTKLHYAFSLSGNFTLANINWHYNHFGIQPYITAGVGTMNYTPVLTLNDGTTQNFKTDNNGVMNELYTPVGLGLKFNVAQGINLDLGYQVNFVYSNNIDGYHYGFNDEKFSYAHAGLEFALGSRSKPQLATHNPVSSMRHEYLWENENTRFKLQSEIDAENAQLAAERAKNDQLRADLNNTNANLAKLTMDSDGDGVPDFFDKCPNTPAGTKVDGSGCPLPEAKQAITKVYITEEDRKVVNQAVRDLEFDFNKATIKEHSLPSLDRLAQLLKDKGFKLKLAGYTDNVGGQPFNLRLSRERAGAVKTYLLSKGVDDANIKAEGYGKEHPIASNKTARGRQLNRRVEFSIYQD
jgi:OmpA-OmpF porin, OOP family